MFHNWYFASLAFLLDLLVGDPSGIPHPVVLMGRGISGAEGLLRRIARRPTGERLAGVVLVIVIVSASYIGTYFIIRGAGQIWGVLGGLATLWLISTTIAARGLDRAAMEIYGILTAGDLPLARKKLAYIVGRDTENLDESEIIRATVETVAENTVDAVVSPVFYAFLCGAPLAMAYRAVNTLDSMVGYRNERYLYFGWAAARLDDIANWIPSRLAGLLLVVAAIFTCKDPRGACSAIRLDARKHPSPNSGIMEAGVAGALEVRLGGLNYYGGVPSFRGYLGPGKRSLRPSDIRDTVRLMYWVALLEFAVLLGTSALWGWV